jgi:hypothetical protein
MPALPMITVFTNFRDPAADSYPISEPINPDPDPG